MTLNHFIHFALTEISAGGFFQNIGFYALVALLAWVVAVQIKTKSGRYRVN
jgi:hypothetical protein